MNKNYETERTTIEGLRSELGSLYDGKKRGTGYFVTTFEDIKENELSISIFDVLDSLEAFEIIEKDIYNSDEEEYEEMDIEEYFEKGLDEGWLTECCADNSFNWNSPISHHINFEIYHNIEEGNYIVRFRVHCGYCDVRVGYTDWVYLECNSDYDFLEALMECGKWIDVEMDGKQYYVTIEVLSDEIRLESYENEEYEEIYGDDRDTILEEMINRELIIW